MIPAIAIFMLCLLPCQESHTLKPYLQALLEAARKETKQGDAFFDSCVRAAVKRASREPETPIAMTRAFLALGCFFDTEDHLQDIPFFGELFEGLEPAEPAELVEAAAERRQLASQASLRGRKDLVLHFTMAAALSRFMGRKSAVQIGIGKEVHDGKELEKGEGLGFSFMDLCANEAGIRFAEYVTAHTAEIARINNLKMSDFFPRLDDLPEGLTYSRFVKQYGGTEDKRFEEKMQRIRKRIDACPGFHSHLKDREKKSGKSFSPEELQPENSVKDPVGRASSFSKSGPAIRPRFR
jgi:hypothetical protein